MSQTSLPKAAPLIHNPFSEEHVELSWVVVFVLGTLAGALGFLAYVSVRRSRRQQAVEENRLQDMLAADDQFYDALRQGERQLKESLEKARREWEQNQVDTPADGCAAACERLSEAGVRVGLQCELTVIYGLDSARHPVPELLDLVAHRPHSVTLYALDDHLQLVAREGQLPPFRTLDELVYEIRKQAELVAFWFGYPAISVKYGFSNFIPGERRCIALLSKISDMIGPGTYRDNVIVPGKGIEKRDLKRYDVVGPFYSGGSEFMAAMLPLLDSAEHHTKYVGCWALRKIGGGVSNDMKNRVLEGLLRVSGDVDLPSVVKEQATVSLRALREAWGMCA